ncbi:MAG: hypothetical protein OEZ06_05635 [Myxococcales bacterium]|nr:hypothetical protein [Myxococcales bacterium]
MTTRLLLSIVATLTLGACATSFTGSAHIDGGRAGCENKCAGQGLAMSGLVYMGEYSSACVCEVPGSGSSAAPVASVAAGAAGVVMQQRRAQQNQQHRAY